jgi:microcin C transport system substrate-binding protein
MKAPATVRPVALLLCACTALAPAHAAEWRHGVAWFDAFRYPAGFTHFDWVDPDAPKGGRIALPARDTFNSFNALIARGMPAAGVGFGSAENWLYDRLLEPAADEPGTSYGRLASAVLVADDFSEVRFRLREAARWHDGVPITAADVVFAFDMIVAHGSPVLRTLLRDVRAARADGEHEVVFDLADGAPRNADLALVLGELFPLPRHYWAGRAFDRTSLEPPLGSGPYRVGRVVPGRAVEWHRVPGYWGRDLPVNRGRFNFDVIRYEYFFDVYVWRQAVRAGALDATWETIARMWATGWVGDDVDANRLVRAGLPVRVAHGPGLVPFFLNLRRPPLDDARVREALWLCRTFDWFNAHQVYGVQRRTLSHFTGTPFEAHGLPDRDELAVLEPLRAMLPPRVFTHAPEAPAAPLSGPARVPLLRADALLREAGWVVRDGRRVDARTGARLSLEFPFSNALGLVITDVFTRNLERLGIEVRLRQVEAAQFANILRNGDFDITLWTLGGALVPVAELHGRYHSASAGVPYSNNYGGVRDRAVDALIERARQAGTATELRAVLRALDRVLLWNFYLVPGYYPPTQNLVYWNRFGAPARMGAWRAGFPDTWWFDAHRDAQVRAGAGLPPPVLPQVLDAPVPVGAPSMPPPPRVPGRQDGGAMAAQRRESAFQR